MPPTSTALLCCAAPIPSEGLPPEAKAALSLQEELKSELKTWEPLLYEQNGAAMLLRDELWRGRTVFEADFCLACDWVHGTQGRVPFIKRFSECDFCHGARNTREVRRRPAAAMYSSNCFPNFLIALNLA